MTQENKSVESNEKLVELNVTLEETFEELEERAAPDVSDDVGWRLASNHNETLVRDLED
jgi:hypothetical protein